MANGSTRGPLQGYVGIATAIIASAILSSTAAATCIRSGTTVSCSDGSSLRTIGNPGYETQTYKDRNGTFTTYQGRFQSGTGVYKADPRSMLGAPFPRRPHPRGVAAFGD
jgi:hypothetical protein